VPDDQSDRRTQGCTKYNLSRAYRQTHVLEYSKIGRVPHLGEVGRRLYARLDKGELW
jgi:hypothetical protein